MRTTITMARHMDVTDDHYEAQREDEYDDDEAGQRKDVNEDGQSHCDQRGEDGREDGNDDNDGQSEEDG